MNGLERVRGTGAALVCLALGLAACDAGDDEPQEHEEAAPSCEAGQHAVLEELTFEASVDYAGDYLGPDLFASMGTPCATAAHAGRCTDAFDLAEQSNHESSRALITTDGDAVKLWSRFSLVALFDGIDTAAEALYFALSIGYLLDCETQVTRVEDRFRITIRGTHDPCFAPLPGHFRIEIDSEGIVREPGSEVPIEVGGCASAGRAAGGGRGGI